ncbi:LIC_10091 family protein [Tautonia plasticadhaerens]|uniref:DUF7790 domain-containing protein n=1 Tax=Tautonia plasticadhaerens TaxID=2527974 RepID=A0A518H3G5_9BACT|nr:hypothetical protein [Tautonia plasticadhaerens]QDV35370.1 hypothetical protein ElP_32730 [Tautonia plasticadhaerens]
MNHPGRLQEIGFPGRDATFAEVIRTLSEPEQGPHGDNFLTNEDSFPRPCGELGRRAAPGGVYLGVGPDQNFTYVAHCDPSLAFVLDYRRRNLRLHLLHKALFMLSDDRVSYLTRLTCRRPGPMAADPTADQLVGAFEASPFDEPLLGRTRAEVTALLRPLGVLGEREWDDLATIQARVAGPGMGARFLALPIYPTFGELIRTPDRDGRPAHLLATEEAYRAVRDAQRLDRVLPLVADLAGDGALPRLAEWLRERGLPVSVLYVSDVEFFLLRAGRFDAYLANLERLPRAEGALIVRTSTREIDHPERVLGDSSTTIARPLSRFLDEARAGRIRTPDDLFGAESGG